MLCVIYQSMFLVRNIFVIISDTEDTIHTILCFLIRFWPFFKFRINCISTHCLKLRTFLHFFMRHWKRCSLLGVFSSLSNSFSISQSDMQIHTSENRLCLVRFIKVCFWSGIFSSSQIYYLYHFVLFHQILYFCQVSHRLYFDIYCLNKILRKDLKLQTSSTFLITYWERLTLPRVCLCQLTFPSQNLISILIKLKISNILYYYQIFCFTKHPK